MCIQTLCMTNVNISYIGKSESYTQKLRSILAQFEFAHEVREWQAKGVPFQTHLYVPEIHPVTQMPFCEREDEAHVLKVRAMLNYGSHYKIAYCSLGCLYYRGLPVIPEVAVQISYSLSVLWKLCQTHHQASRTLH